MKNRDNNEKQRQRSEDTQKEEISLSCLLFARDEGVVGCTERGVPRFIHSFLTYEAQSMLMPFTKQEKPEKVQLEARAGNHELGFSFNATFNRFQKIQSWGVVVQVRSIKWTEGTDGDFPNSYIIVKVCKHLR